MKRIKEIRAAMGGVFASYMQNFNLQYEKYPSWMIVGTD
jgi:hypothetical protein